MTDIRTVRTKEKIRKAFIQLIEQRDDFDKINVADITDVAGINRVTFYTHYQDRDELLKEIIEMFAKDCTLNALGENATHANSTGTLLEVSVSAATSFASKCNDHRTLLVKLSQSRDGGIQELFVKVITDQIASLVEKPLGKKIEISQRTNLDFLIAGYIKLIFTWLTLQYESYPEFLQRIKEITRRLVIADVINNHD